MNRKPHKKKKVKIDIMKPILFTDLGTENDPCFGKHYSITASECKRCGDSDVCAILCQNNMHKEYQEQESKNRFKDVEEGQLIDKQNRKLEKLLITKGKKKPDTWLSLEKLVPKVRVKFNLTKPEDPQILQRLIKAGENAEGITLNKSLTKYRYEK